MGLGRKRKYSIVCLFASQFCQLRDRFCPSEVDFIASLSRCRNWDAKGGKSKSLFAKTLDDRLIIKEIQRTELDSFMKFATNYFEYMNECYDLRNQTCLAKILGIYQVQKAASSQRCCCGVLLPQKLLCRRGFGLDELVRWEPTAPEPRTMPRLDYAIHTCTSCLRDNRIIAVEGLIFGLMLAEVVPCSVLLDRIVHRLQKKSPVPAGITAPWDLLLRKVKVKRRGDDTKYVAKVLARGVECDLALLSVESKEFWEGVEPLHLGNSPNLQEEIEIESKALCVGEALAVECGCECCNSICASDGSYNSI